MKTINIAKQTGPNTWTRKTYRIPEAQDWGTIGIAVLVIGYVLIRSLIG